MRRKDREVSNMVEIEAIIRKCDVCRIAFSDGSMPYIVTMNFGYESDGKRCLYFHSAPAGKKTELIKKNNYVCFQMDTDHLLYGDEAGCSWGMKYSSIVGYGKIFKVGDKSEKIKGLDSIMFHYTDRKDFTYDQKMLETTMVLRLDIEQMTAKRII